MFQELESPGKTEKGKHQINKENGSCQKESTKRHMNTEKRAQHQAQLGNQKSHPSDANKGRRKKPVSRQACLLVSFRTTHIYADIAAQHADSP